MGSPGTVDFVSKSSVDLTRQSDGDSFKTVLRNRRQVSGTKFMFLYLVTDLYRVVNKWVEMRPWCLLIDQSMGSDSRDRGVWSVTLT